MAEAKPQPAPEKPAPEKPAPKKPAPKKPAARKTAGTKTAATAKKPRRRTKKPVLMSDAEIETFFARLAAKTPEPETELNFTNVYTLLVAVALSAQATDVGVNKATGPLFEKVSTPAEMVALGEEGLKEYIRTIGLFNSKAKNVIALSEMLIAEHGGEVPRDRAALEALPGVGRKTANVVLNNYWGEPTIAVDTHLFRVSNRVGMAPGKTPLAVELGLEARIPDHWKRHAHHWLILHGRYTCKARKPECLKCQVADLCKFEEKVLT